MSIPNIPHSFNLSLNRMSQVASYFSWSVNIVNNFASYGIIEINLYRTISPLFFNNQHALNHVKSEDFCTWLIYRNVRWYTFYLPHTCIFGTNLLLTYLLLLLSRSWGKHCCLKCFHFLIISWIRPSIDSTDKYSNHFWRRSRFTVPVIFSKIQIIIPRSRMYVSSLLVFNWLTSM